MLPGVEGRLPPLSTAIVNMAAERCTRPNCAQQMLCSVARKRVPTLPKTRRAHAVCRHVFSVFALHVAFSKRSICAEKKERKYPNR